MALTGWAGVPAAAAEPVATPAASGSTGASYDITLVTGDVVHFTDLPGDHDIVTVDPADGASGGVQVQTQGGHTFVVPERAMPLLAADRLDPRLFDVTGLVAMGYDDARAGSVPLIATASGRGRSARPPAVPEGAARVRTLGSIDASALHADKDRARTFWKAVAPGAAPDTLAGGIGKLWLDGRVTASLADDTAQIKANAAWQKGYDGKGVRVAVLDTGADLDHPDLAGQVEASRSFVDGEAVDDGNGHGTHVASTIAGTGAASGGTEKGAAPGARLLVGKVLADAGTGADSDTIAGMEWAKAQGADIVSMSLGSPEPSDGDDPMSLAVDALSADGGPLYVIAAGNAYDPGSIGAPGAASAALTVGAVDGHDERAAFSSQGPLDGSHRLKPDVSAPGVDVTAAASQSVPGWTGGLYRTMSGTSMATPLVSGAAAILKQRHPDWSGERVKAALMTTSERTAESPYEVGTGRIDTAAALDSVTEATGSVEAAAYNWPNADAKPTVRTITYRNDGDRDVTLDLTTGTDEDAYTLSASRLRLPAGSTADVTLTLDPSKVPAGTTYSGQVAATDAATGAVVAHTGFALFKEREMYDFTIKVRDRDGKPASDSVVLYDPTSTTPEYFDVDGERTLRLPPGRYTASSYMDVPGDGPDSLGTAFLLAPEVSLGPDHPGAAVTLDASEARKAYAVPQRESETVSAVFGLARDYPGAADHDWSSSMQLPVAYDSVYLTPTPKPADGSLDGFLHWRMRQKTLDARTGGGPDIALLAQSDTAYHDGTRNLPLVYAGQGAAADYAGLDARGKAVVIERSDAVTANARAQAAADAGAAMLLIVNDAPGRLYQSYTGGGDVTVATVERTPGATLIAEARTGRKKLKTTQRQFPDYTYDMVQKFQGGLSTKAMVYRPHDHELARVDNSFYAPAGTPGFGGRYFVPAWGPALGGDSYERYGRTVTEYVTPGTQALGTWWEQHEGLGPAAGYRESGYAASYSAGKPYDGAWFKPVQAPRAGKDFGVYQNRTLLNWNIPVLSGGGDGHTGFGGTARSRLTRDGVQVAASNSRSGRASNLAAGSYELTVTGERPAAPWTTSVRTETTWGFDYAPLSADGPGRADLPLLNLGYDVDTDLQGTARAGKRLALGLSAATFPGDVTARTATLQVSYDDGATWSDAELKRTGDGRWTADLRTPRDATALSLRAAATAPRGLSVRQDVVRAVTLR
ncbi:S8 family serine peptidase [Streptomyces sp. 130]|nr:S8 family serine peptidase [Streptomyces sp. 130]